MGPVGSPKPPCQAQVIACHSVPAVFLCRLSRLHTFVGARSSTCARDVGHLNLRRPQKGWMHVKPPVSLQRLLPDEEPGGSTSSSQHSGSASAALAEDRPLRPLDGHPYSHSAPRLKRRVCLTRVRRPATGLMTAKNGHSTSNAETPLIPSAGHNPM